MIHQLKYSSVKSISTVCAQMMFMQGSLPTVDVVTSIPLHRLRKNSRGFNQAEEIATQFASQSNMPYATLLQRLTHTTNLAQITNIRTRKKVIEHQFTIIPHYASQLSNKTILVIDDVWTTGATLEEVAKILKSHGVKEVHGFSFAHGQ